MAPKQATSTVHVAPGNRRRFRQRAGYSRLQCAVESLLHRDLRSVVRIATLVIGRRESAHLWLVSPQRVLGNRIPANVARTKRGRGEVLNLLGAIEDGRYI